jgi:hypothetical protein
MPWENKSSLAKAAIVLSAILCLSFGLCGVGVILTLHPNQHEEFNISAMSVWGFRGFVVSLLGLLLVLVSALGKYFYKRNTDKGDQQ